MYSWKVTFLVNGKRTEAVVKAYSGYDAKKLIEAQYSGAKISFISVVRA